MPDESATIGLALVLLLGIGAQWLAWRIRVPAILVLLVFGFLASSHVSGLMNPDRIFGDLLLPIVSLSVAIILFEGGLTLRIGELRSVGRVVRNLVTIGVLATWLVGTAAAWWLLDYDLPVALLLGAILTVTGPTVIGPLLRQVRPTGEAGSALKWEGIIIDPIGASLAVLVFEFVSVAANANIEDATLAAVMSILRTILIGGGLGLLVSFIMAYLFHRHLVPDYLQPPVSLMLVLVTFAASNHFQHESGLLAVTLMGAVLSNQTFSSIRHIVEFKENLQVLLISSLFILLAARLEPQEILSIGWQGLAFVVVLILIARPLSVYLSTLGSGMSWRQRLFVAWVAPRGIVAAAVASVFALKLEKAFGVPEAETLVPITFLTIIATVMVYGLTAGPLARWLGVADQDPQGVLIVGAHRWARQIAKVIQDQGFRVLLVDNNRYFTHAARMADLPTYTGSIMSEAVQEDLDLGGLGTLMAMTSNDGVNSVAAHSFKPVFSQRNVYQLNIEKDDHSETARHLRGRPLFGPRLTYHELNARFEAGATVKATPLTEKFDYDAFVEWYGEMAIPLLVVTENGKLQVRTGTESTPPRPGSTLIALVHEEGDDTTAAQRVERKRVEQTKRQERSEQATAAGEKATQAESDETLRHAGGDSSEQTASEED